MKKIIIILVSGIAILLTGFIYYVKYSEVAKKASEHVAHSQKVHIGMNVIEVKKIMGPPDDEYPHYSNENVRVFFYEPPFGASDGIEFYFDTNDVVVKIVPFEPT